VSDGEISVIIFANSYQLTGYAPEYKPNCCKILESCQNEECGRQLISPKMFGPTIMDKNDGKRNPNLKIDPHFDRQVNVCGVCKYKVWKNHLLKEVRNRRAFEFFQLLNLEHIYWKIGNNQSRFWNLIRPLRSWSAKNIINQIQ